MASINVMPIYFMCICRQLRDAFLQQLTQGYSHYDRQLRNDLLVLMSLIAGMAPHAPFTETGFVKQLTLFATFQEGKYSTGNLPMIYVKVGYSDTNY